MPFTPFDRTAHARTALRDRQGPPKLTVVQTAKGRTTVSLSGAVRDHLSPTVTQRDPRRSPEKVMVIRLLVDPEARKIAIERMPDDADPRESYQVSGLNSGSAYFTDHHLDTAIGLLSGTYEVSLTQMRRGEKSTLAAVISLDDRQPPEQRKRRDKLALQIETIVSIRDEGITLVEPGKKF